MHLWLADRDTEDRDGFRVEFTPQMIVGSPALYLLIYSLGTTRYVGENARTETPVFKEFHLTRMHHVMHGHFTYKNIKYDAQVGCFLRKYGMQGFTMALFHHIPVEPFFKNIFFDFGMEKREVMVVDFDGFNQERKMIGREEISFREYLTKRLSESIVDDNGLTMHDETTLFNVVDEQLDAEDFITSKGMGIFLEEHIKRNRP